MYKQQDIENKLNAYQLVSRTNTSLIVYSYIRILYCNENT